MIHTHLQLDKALPLIDLLFEFPLDFSGLFWHYR
jgi:hypothetical protein